MAVINLNDCKHYNRLDGTCIIKKDLCRIVCEESFEFKDKYIGIGGSGKRLKTFILKGDTEGLIFTVGDYNKMGYYPSVNEIKQLQETVIKALEEPPFYLFLPEFVTVKKIKIKGKKKKKGI